MSSLKNRLRTMLPKSMRELIIKKVSVEGISVFEEMIVINLSLRHFYNINSSKSVGFTLSNGAYNVPLDFELNKNNVSLILTNDIFEHLEGNSTIKMSFEGKNMIIRMSDNLQSKTSFLKNQQYYNLLVNGTIILEQLFNEYTFNEESIEVKDVSVAYERLSVTVKEKSYHNACLALLYPNKIVELGENSNGQSITADDFTNVTMGRATLCILEDLVLTPISYNGAKKSLVTKAHHLEVENNNAESLVFIENHSVILTDIQSKVSSDYMQLIFNCDIREGIDSVILNDTVTNDTTTFDVNVDSKGLYYTNIPFEDLMEDFSRKRFSILSRGNEPVIMQPDLSDYEKSKIGEMHLTSYHYENIKIWLYRRKDKGLGFNLTRPRIKRQVTEIENFHLKGYTRGRENFTETSMFMIFEDRYSKEQSLVPIDVEFNMDLSEVDLKGLKSKDKTIIDIFIGMVHENGEIIRKEKIKYKYSDYKKDNYYGVKTEKDEEGNTHYFLVTTTPFNNLKVESFVIPEGVPLPMEKPEKDYSTWLVGERYDTAQDNGYAFYKYLRENTDINAYYVIEDTAPDYRSISSDPNVLAFGSNAHYQISFKAGVLLGTHDLENLLPYKPARGFFNYEETIKVFLQHGVLGRKRVEYHRKYYDLPFNLFIVSSTPEKENVVVKKLGYNEDEVAVTGLARFDSLPRGNETKDILLMPTWRDWINTDEQFLSSQYFNNYNNLIHNERLIKLLEENDVRLNFYPHYRAQMYFNNEILNPSKNINFIQLGSKTVQDLLIEHSLLITDYSSVSFDFTLMNKPVIYYHFDVRKFFRQGKLRPLYQTFIGSIARTEDELVDLIQQQIHLNFKPGDIDISGIFDYQDHNNSQRIYHSVLGKIAELEQTEDEDN